VWKPLQAVREPRIDSTEVRYRIRLYNACTWLNFVKIHISS